MGGSPYRGAALLSVRRRGREVLTAHAAVAATHRGRNLLCLVSHDNLGGEDKSSDLARSRLHGLNQGQAATGQLGHSLLKLLAVVVAVRLVDLSSNLVHATKCTVFTRWCGTLTGR